MIVEFSGIPGAGKSTIASLLSERAGFENIEVPREKRWKYALAFFLKHPFFLLWLILATIHQSLGNIGLFRRKIFLLGSYVIRTQKALERSHSGTVILDEGLLHYFLSLYEREVNQNTALRYIQHGFLTDLVLWVDTNEEEARRRMEKRGRGLPRRKLNIDHERWMRTFIKNAETYKRSLEESGVPMIVLDADSNTPDESVLNIMSKLSSPK